MYSVNITRTDMFAFLSHSWLWQLRIDGPMLRKGSLECGWTHKIEDISSTWHDHHTADNQYMYPNPVSLTCIISIFSTHQVAMAVAPHAHKELAAPMHSWHLYDAEGAVDIFTTGAFMSPCLWGWGEAQWKGESGLGCREEEGEMSKFRRSQLPEEHIAPGRKITVSCSVPSLSLRTKSVLAAVWSSSAPSW